MKQESDLRPNKSYEIENIRDDRCEVVFFDLDSIEEQERIDEEGNVKIVYLFNSYRQNMSYYDGVNEYILNNYETLLNKAKESDYESVAREVREKRNALLEETDKDMAFDRLGVEFPDFDIPSLTLSNVLKFVKSLAECVKALGDIFRNILNSDMATYRQALRDITEQEGFPYNVVFPEKPKK